jgi:hypothetical protein
LIRSSDMLEPEYYSDRAHSPSRKVARKESNMAAQRPVGVTILAVLALLAAGVALMHTLQMLHLWPIFLGPVAFFTFDLFGALCWGALTAIYIWLLMMLWNVKPQAWLYLILVAGLNLFLAFLSILGASSFQAMLPAILINGLILVYCLLPGTKQAFGVPT